LVLVEKENPVMFMMYADQERTSHYGAQRLQEHLKSMKKQTDCSQHAYRMLFVPCFLSKCLMPVFNFLGLIS
jgi:hypothetical protein